MVYIKSCDNVKTNRFIFVCNTIRSYDNVFTYLFYLSNIAYFGAP